MGRLFFSILAMTLSAAAAPSFYKDVLPLFQAHCQSCHRAGEAAPMALTDYATARPWAKAIQQAVVERAMPPWFADPHVGKFSNDARLADSEIATISEWVNAGAPEGDSKDAPQPVAWVPGWKIGAPEIVIEMPHEVEVPVSGTLGYKYVTVPTNFKEDTWVRLAEVRPGDRAHTHHIVVSVKEPGSQEQGEFLAGYGPGSVPEMLGAGQAKLIKAGSELVFQLHYTTDGKPGRDRSRVGLILAHEKPRERVMELAAANVRFAVPAGDPDYRVEARVTLYEDATLVSLLPHMHLRGKSFEFRVAYPDGRKETLLTVPRYSYDWQLSYYLDRPLRLPQGSTIECTAHFDNSPNNPRNPDPAKTVRFGAQSWDEMMIGYFEVAVDPRFGMRDLLLARPGDSDR
ncbi:MAG TPA: cytochrome c [Bryobacteraceae bacterium]|nr:cytochrome c [Bryobacteraceae bacterium]